MSLDAPIPDDELARIAARRIQKGQAMVRADHTRFSTVTISIPFKHLVPDNQKYGVLVQKGRPRMLLRPQYRAAKDCIQHIARKAMNGARLAMEDVELHARLWMPDARRRDASNYSKLCHDSLQGAVFEDDTQIKCCTWENMGIDRENPRCEITVTRRAA